MPDAPATVLANSDDKSAVIDFTAPANNGAAAIDYYVITAIPTPASGKDTLHATASPFTFTGLTNGTTYTFTVAAHNSVGIGATITSLAITPAATVTYTAGGWSTSTPPNNQSVIIADGSPVIPANTTVKSITIAPGATPVVNGTLTVTGSTFTNNGTITGTGTITLGGTTAQTVSGTGTLPNLAVSNTAGITIAPTTTTTTNGVVTTTPTAINVTGVISLNNVTTNGTTTGSTLTIAPGAFVVLKSTSIDNSAVIGVVCPTCKILGNITVERFIPAGFRAYRDLATGVFNSTTYAQNPAPMSNGSIFTNWQENGSYTNNGYGMFITGTTNPAGTTFSSNAVDAITGLDVSKNSVPSVYFYNNAYDAAGTASPFVSITNTKNSLLSPFLTYRILVRGDRSFDLYNTGIVTYGPVLGLRSYNNTSVRSTGSLITGDVLYNKDGVTNALINNGNPLASVSENGINTSIALSTNNTGLNGTSAGYTRDSVKNGVAVKDAFGNQLYNHDDSLHFGYGWSMIANPYLCPVLWNDGSLINSNASGTGGVYNNVGTNDVDATYYYLDPTNGATGKYISCTSAGCSNGTKAEIQSGQSIFFRGLSSTPSVLFKETNKVPDHKKQGVFGISTISTLPVVLNRKIDATLGYQKVDMSTLYFNKNYSNTVSTEDGEKIVGAADNIYFKEAVTNLGVDGRNIPTAKDVIPVELNKVSKADYQLVIDGSAYSVTGYMPILVDSYKKSITGLTGSAITYSFTVDTADKASYVGRFSIAFKATSLPISNIIVTAKQVTSGVNVSWTAIGATATTSYTVEKSTDGASFTTLATTTVTNYVDNNATGTVYYRIKATDVDGSVSYSNTAKLTINSSLLATVNVYPNPMVGKTLNVAFIGVTKGKYTVTLSNILGQQVHSEVITHTGGTATHGVTTGILAKGVYQLKVISKENNNEIYQASIEVE